MSLKCMFVCMLLSLLQRMPNLGRDKHGWLWHEAQADTQRVDEAFLSATSLSAFETIFTVSIQHPASLAENAWTDSSKQTALSGSTASKLPTSVATLIQSCEIAVFVCVFAYLLWEIISAFSMPMHAAKSFARTSSNLTFRRKTDPSESDANNYHIHFHPFPPYHGDHFHWFPSSCFMFRSGSRNHCLAEK